MPYKIKQLQKDKAKELGVVIAPSKNPEKKIDVFIGDKKVASIGNKNYSDYATYRKENGVKYADERKRLYKLRHNKTRQIKNSNSYYADKILWE